MVGLVADLTAEMAESIHMCSDLADLGRQELVVPNGATAGTVRPAGRAAGHAQAEDAARRQRDLGVVFVTEPDDLV